MWIRPHAGSECGSDHTAGLLVDPDLWWVCMWIRSHGGSACGSGHMVGLQVDPATWWVCKWIRPHGGPADDGNIANGQSNTGLRELEVDSTKLPSTKPFHA